MITVTLSVWDFTERQERTVDPEQKLIDRARGANGDPNIVAGGEL